MYLEDHNPPHFHAIYGDHEAQVAIADGRIIEGELPRTATRLVRDWALVRHTELMDNWNRSRSGEPPTKILGLDAD
jgi:hypothetical protein